MITRPRTKLHPYRVFFWTSAVLVAALFLLDRHPLTLAAADPELGGRIAHVEGRGDALVVISEDGILELAAEAGFDRSWAWVDLIIQEIGPVTTIDLADLDAERLQEFRLVILTRSAAASESVEPLIAELETFATNGGVLAMELPEGLLRARFSADGQGGWRRAGAITAADGVPDAVLEQMRAIPLLTRYRGSTGAVANSHTMLAIDGAPVIYTRRIGGGEVITFDFEVGAQISRLQQGTPTDDFRVQPRRYGQPVRTFDLASTPALIGTTTPYADLLERYIAHAVFGHDEPVFALWPYPDAARGALLTSHSSRHLDGRPLWMSIHERSLDARSTTFLAAPAGESDRPALFADPDFVGHAAMLWVLDPDDAGLFRRYGVLGFDPVRQSLTLGGQLEALELTLGDDADIRGVRIWDGRWTPRFTDAFRAMDAADLRYSTTYGPPPEGPPGFLFGTCQPYTPVDVDGLPFRLREVPVCFYDPESEEELRLFQEALENAARDAWAVHLLTSADRFIDQPDLDGFDIWRDALRFADRNDMWVGGAGEMVAFQRRRSNAALHVISREITSTDAEGHPRVIEYTVEVETGGRGQALMVPAAVGDLAFEQATRGGPETQLYDVAGQVETEAAQHLGRDVQLLPLNPGFTTVGLRYRR